MEDFSREPAKPVGLVGLALSLVAGAGLGIAFFMLIAAAAAGLQWLVTGSDTLFALFSGDRGAPVRADHQVLEFDGILTGCLIYLAVIAALVTLALVQARGRWAELLGWRGFKPDLRYLGLIAGGIVYGVLASLAIEYIHPAARDWFVMPKALDGVLATFALVVIAAPLAEELLFRGWIYTSLRSRFGFGSVLGITSTIFALAHWENTHLYSLAVFPIGVALGFVRERYDSTRASALFHALYNLSGWVLTYFGLG